MLSLIAAIGKNNELGKNGVMPWNIKEDLEYFKSVTMNSTIIMGRKTFESLPGILPNRRHIVITKDKNYKNKNIEIINSLDKIKDYKKPFIIGGGEIYEATIDKADKLYITRIDKSFDADTFFPNIDHKKFKIISTSEKMYSPIEEVNFTFEIYERK